MGPITKFNWYDNSAIGTASPTPEQVNALFLTAFTADKGTEQMIRIKGEDFYKMYGSSLSFARHGQVLLQAGKIIDAGGELLCKRIVAYDATLSNIILTVQVTNVTKQEKDADTGQPLYIDAATGDTTTEQYDAELHENEKYTVTNTVIKWLADNSVTNCKTSDEVYEAAESLYQAYNQMPIDDYKQTLPEEERDQLFTDVSYGIYPLYVITDIGRNADVKSIRIVPKYEVSRRLGFMIYTLSEIEGATVNENVTVTANPNLIYNNVSYAITDKSMGELKTIPVSGMLEAYVTKLSELTGIPYEQLINMDVFFGCNIKGASIDGVTVDTDGIDISGEFGVKLASGSNGTEFDYNGTTAYYKSDAYAEALCKFYRGYSVQANDPFPYDDQIYNVDVHKIVACVDANYPIKVKNAITELADFREDFFVFRDYTTDVYTFADALDVQSKLKKTRFAADYLTTYDVIDPYTRKRIRVTMMYDLVQPLVVHFSNSPYAPFAGVINGFVLSNAIEGTINFVPVTTPEFDQIGLLDDVRVNYATYHEYNGDLTVVSLYTSQDAYTQLSYVNNVVAIQEVMRALRTACPRNRYRLQTGNDFSDYKQACSAVLKNFTNWFAGLAFIYQQDDLEADQKIFHAAIEFAFNNWVQSEIFDLYAIPTALVTE